MDEITVTAHLPGLDIAIRRRPHPLERGEELLTIGLHPTFQLGPLGEEIVLAAAQRAQSLLTGGMLAENWMAPYAVLLSWQQQMLWQSCLAWSPWLSWLGQSGRTDQE